MRILLFIILFFTTHLVLAQEHCVHRPWFVPTDLFPTNPEFFNSNAHVHIAGDFFSLDNDSILIVEQEIFLFDSKDDLLRTMACIYDFPGAPENITGSIIKYQLEGSLDGVGDQFTLVIYDDCGDKRFYGVTQFGLYRFSNSVFWLEDDYLLPYQDPISYDTIEYIDASQIDTTVVILITQVPVIDTLSELVLLKEGYTVIQNNESVFDSVTIYIQQEFSSCSEAIYDTSYEQYLVRDAHIEFEVFPAQFETVTEQVLVRTAYSGGLYFEREIIDSVVITTSYLQTLLSEYNVTNDCSGTYFYPCLDVSLDSIAAVDTVIRDYILPCPSEYITAGNYCYNNIDEHPAEYESRQYEKLSTPASVGVIEEIPAEYTLIELVTISNKDELDESCIELRQDSLVRYQLITPSFVSFDDIPTEYETRDYYQWVTGAEFTVSHIPDAELFSEIPVRYGNVYYPIYQEVKQPVDWNTCMDLALRKAMVREGLIVDVEVSNQDFYQAVLDYQISQGLTVGIISEEMVELLNVQFGF